MMLKRQQVCNRQLKLYQTFQATLRTAAQNRLNRGGTFSLLFQPGVDASHVYVGAWALVCFHSLISTQTPSTGLRHPSFTHCRI